MIGQILSSVTGLATSWLDSKAQQKLLETQIKKKHLTGEIDWELEAIRSAQDSWKYELCAIDYADVLKGMNNWFSRKYFSVIVTCHRNK